jgi:hypothetical protein
MNSASDQEQALAFYRAALCAARAIDQEGDHRVLDGNADAAWRAYGSDLPAAIRFDLVLRDFAMLYPAGFAPGPVFGLAGWYEDDPWGTGFERPESAVVETVFASRSAPITAAEALQQALSTWGVATGEAIDPRLADRIAPTTNLVVAGERALAEVARAFLAGEHLSARTQILLVSDRPAARHILGLVCALRREAGLPHLLDRRRDDETATAWADRQKQRFSGLRAHLLVLSQDADAEERERARALAAALGADEVAELPAAAAS